MSIKAVTAKRERTANPERSEASAEGTSGGFQLHYFQHFLQIIIGSN